MPRTTAIAAGNDASRRHGLFSDLIVAVALAALLTVGWALHDWQRLSRMLLPDPDDMMRLAQVRDWLAGQATNDWTQYRMAPPAGAPMHWSRINDLGIAALILLATPAVGQAHAELIAVLVYPALLFAGAMFLSARIARRLWGAAAGFVAAVLTAVAYPGTTVFIPGRIDHHALQVVLIQLLVLAMMRAPTIASGAAAGAVTGISLVVGLESAPQVAALVSVLGVLWIARGMAERLRLAGFAAGLSSSTVVFLLFLRPHLWSPTLCDAFTPASASGTLAVAAALAALAAATPYLARWPIRVAAATAAGAVALGATLIVFPACLAGPYGAMNPFLRHAFLPFIEEANGIFDQTRLARIIALAGAPFAACAAAIWMMARARDRWAELAPVAAVVVVSGLILLAQVRGAYIGAPLGAPILAGLVIAARRRATWRLPALIAAWLVGAGTAYATIAEGIERRISHDPTIDQPKPHVVCSAGDTWAQVDRAPPGIVMTGTHVAAYLIGATHHATIGGGYHRNDRGNMAMYRFFLNAPDTARTIGRQWRIDYVMFCPGDFSEIDVTTRYPRSLAARLEHGHPPDWLRPIPIRGSLRFYRVVPPHPLS